MGHLLGQRGRTHLVGEEEEGMVSRIGFAMVVSIRQQGT
jgi:hypothetical protein